MQNFMYVGEKGSETIIDPNNVIVNVTATKMKVATYPKENADRGDKQPIFVNFRSLKLKGDNLKKMTEIFKEKQSELLKLKKAKQIVTRRNRVKRLVLTLAMGAN